MPKPLSGAGSRRCNLGAVRWRTDLPTRRELDRSSESLAEFAGRHGMLQRRSREGARRLRRADRETDPTRLVEIPVRSSGKSPSIAVAECSSWCCRTGSRSTSEPTSNDAGSRAWRRCLAKADPAAVGTHLHRPWRCRFLQVLHLQSGGGAIAPWLCPPLLGRQGDACDPVLTRCARASTAGLLTAASGPDTPLVDMISCKAASAGKPVGAMARHCWPSFGHNAIL